MPMDIRNFFGKAPAGKKGSPKKKTSSAGTAASKKAESKAEPKKRKALEPKNQKPTPEENKEMSPEAFFAMSNNQSNSNKSKPKSSAVPSPAKKPKLPQSSPKKQTTPKSPASADSAASKKRMRVEDKDDSDYTDDTFEPADDVPEKSPAKPKTPKAKTASASPPSTAKRSRTSTGTNKAASPKTPKITLLEPTLELDSFNTDDPNLVPECLQGLTFVFTGVLEDLGREEAMEMVKILGGRVTGAVSGKTSYLVIGETLEDGRPYTEGSKYKASVEKNVRIVIGEKKFFGLCQLYQERARKEKGVPPPPPKTTQTPATNAPPAPAPAPAVVAPKANPYLTKKVVANNPYAKKATNPYAKKAANPYAKAPTSATPASTPQPVKSATNQLWVDRHAPTSTREILGNKESINKLTNWLRSWETTFNNPKAYNKTFSNPRGPWKAALLSGPPGIGKTTTATLVAKEAGRDLREFNASDARSKKALQQQLGDLTGSQTLGFQGLPKGAKMPAKKLRCIIMDEVDGMGAGDRSGMAELIQMIKKSKVPIICICNDRQSQKMKSLLPYCMDLRFKRPTKSIMANRAVRIAQMEGLQVERNAAEAIAESCGNDVRQVLNVLQMWAQKKGDEGEKLTYKNLKDREKSINKDEILRVGLFDAAKTIMEGRRGLANASAKTQRDSIFKRSDAFFVDYSLTGLLVQQNYPKVMQGQYSSVKLNDNPDEETKFLQRQFQAADSMSDFAIVEHAIRTGDQNWSLLPTCGMMAVKTGYHAGGENGGMLPGYPEFTAWMGKNSSKSKKKRMLSELHHHMNFKISGDSQQLRDTYLPVLREKFWKLFQRSSEDSTATQEIIALMDEYGLSREDVMEKLDEFKIGKTGSTFADLDSKYKAAFTRTYNQGSHKSQALVKEEYAAAKPKKRGGKRERDPNDLDAIDEDGVEEESEAEDEEAELKKLQEKLKRKGRKKGAAKAGKNKKK